MLNVPLSTIETTEGLGSVKERILAGNSLQGHLTRGCRTPHLVSTHDTPPHPLDTVVTTLTPTQHIVFVIGQLGVVLTEPVGSDEP